MTWSSQSISRDFFQGRRFTRSDSQAEPIEHRVTPLFNFGGIHAPSSRYSHCAITSCYREIGWESIMTKMQAFAAHPGSPGYP